MPSIGLKNLPPKVKKTPMLTLTPPDPIESNTTIVDGDVQINNKYLFLGSPRLSASLDGGSQKEIRRMSDSQEGLAMMAGGTSKGVAKKAKGFFEAKAKELRESANQAKKHSPARSISPTSSSNIALGTIRGMYIRAETGWVKLNIKQGKEIADSPGTPATRPSRNSLSLSQLKAKSAVGTKKALFEKKANAAKKMRNSTAKVKRKKKTSGFIKSNGKWVAPGEKVASS